MFDELSAKLTAALQKLTGRGVLTEEAVKAGLREIRRVLLEADVSFDLTREFLERVEQRSVGAQLLKAVRPGDQLVKIVYDELVVLLGEKQAPLVFASVPPTIILLVGPDSALLEGLSQSLAALGYVPVVARELSEARDMATTAPPLIAVVEGVLAGSSSAEVLGIPLAPGGAVLLYRATGQAAPMLVPTVRRAVLADLTLPLERHRLIALVQHVVDRARATGRRPGDSPPERVAP